MTATDRWVRLVRGFRGGERGQGLTEYALILLGVFLIVFGAVLVLGGQVNALFGRVVQCFQGFSGC